MHISIDIEKEVFPSQRMRCFQVVKYWIGQPQVNAYLCINKIRYIRLTTNITLNSKWDSDENASRRRSYPRSVHISRNC